MVDWQITATTIYCDAVDDEVTFLVSKDWSVNCTGKDKYAEPDKETAKLLKRRGKQLERELKCEGLSCHRVVGYKDKLYAEETKKGVKHKK